MTTPAALNQQDTTMIATMYIGDQIFGIPILDVRDILTPEHVFTIPMAPTAIAGVINLRGRIVTVLDMHKRFGFYDARHRNGYKTYCVTVQQNNELYGLLFDRVGNVIEVSPAQHEPTPSTLSRRWRDCCQGVYRLDKELLLLLDVEALLHPDMLNNLPAQRPTRKPAEPTPACL